MQMCGYLDLLYRRDSKIGAKVGVIVATFHTGLLPREGEGIQFESGLIFFYTYMYVYVKHSWEANSRVPLFLFLFIL